MFRRPIAVVALVLSAIGVYACGSVDIAKSVTVVDTLSGFYDDGVVPEGRTHAGWNRILPSLTFKLRNDGPKEISSIQLTVSFWQDGDDGEKDSAEVRGVGPEGLKPGATTESITVRPPVIGINQEGRRADIFQHPQFKDWVVKLFAKHGGNIVRLGEFKVDRRLIPHIPTSAGRP
jgi:hypothetical protein